MIYKPFKDLQLSTLGLGNMRLPTTGDRSAIDPIKARQLIEYAYQNGINYFDTAYMYHGGNSEGFVGDVLRQYPRDSWYLASKMPGHSMRYADGKLEFVGLMSGLPPVSPEEIFETQLKRCGVDYFDFYLLHNVCETSYGIYTDPDLRMVEYFAEQKRLGRIRHLGFSAHGRAETIDRFLDTYDCFEFVQIQLNYVDWVLQDGRKKAEVIGAHGLPVIVMEPVRGGKLAELDEPSSAPLKSARPGDSLASWAFRFLQSLPNIQVVLSGMSTMEQLQENIELFSRPDPTTPEENALLMGMVEELAELIPCTACRYCCDGCPQRLDIPKLISMYNEMKFDRPFTLNFTLDAMEAAELPAACIACGVCTTLCPQDIDIPGIMERFAQLLAARAG